MTENLFFIVLLGFGLVAGIRHGIDFDHIAAITDISSSQKKSSQALFYSILYGLGHGLMVIILGGIMLILGFSLPENLNYIFGKIVGLTLISLGLYVLLSILKKGRSFRMESRWSLIFSFFGLKPKFASKTSFGIGLVHGLGAETPTQIGALLVLLKTGGGMKGFLFLLSFVLGIFICNILLAILSIYGYKKIQANPKIYIAVGTLTSIFSLLIGIMFLIA